MEVLYLQQLLSIHQTRHLCPSLIVSQCAFVNMEVKFDYGVDKVYQ